MDDDILLREDEGAVATLTLNNPGKLNALSEAMLQALEAELGLLAGESEIRVVILRGAGRAFCAGHDLKEMTQARQAEDGGLGGKGVWAPATTGLSPGKHNDVMTRYLAGGFVGAYGGGSEETFEE